MTTKRLENIWLHYSLQIEAFLFFDFLRKERRQYFIRGDNRTSTFLRGPPWEGWVCTTCASSWCQGAQRYCPGSWPVLRKSPASPDGSKTQRRCGPAHEVSPGRASWTGAGTPSGLSHLRGHTVYNNKIVSKNISLRNGILPKNTEKSHLHLMRR